MDEFDEIRFKTRVNNALIKVRTILDNTRTPQFAADVAHEYEDKYLLAEFIVNSTIAAQINSLMALGVNEKQLIQMKQWAKTKSVTLRLKAEENCVFIRKTEREVQSDTKSVSKSTLFGTSESYTITKVTEYFYSFHNKYELVAFMGNEYDKPIIITTRSGTIELKTSTDSLPKPATTIYPSVDVNITWLLNNLTDDNKSNFTINRLVPTCHTPRRNTEIEAAFTFMLQLWQWSNNIQSYFSNVLFPIYLNHALDLKSIKQSNIFVPVLPLFEKPKSKKHSKHSKDKHKHKEKQVKETKSPRLIDEVIGSGVIPIGYVNLFLEEQKNSIAETFKDLAKVFPVNEKTITLAEAKIIIISLHLKQICESFSEGINYIEDMLRKQLIAAIGKEVTALDFTNYLRFHNRKLYKLEYQPRPFCYAIRRPDHYPEGTLSIENQLDDGSIPDPIHTSVCWSNATRPMQFSIDASTKVSFFGDRYLHGYISHQFSGESQSRLSLAARARQFSSFILLVGSIASADLFDPKYGIIIQNKDDLLIPLCLETIPTAKEFKDAIESLSEEQQRFAKAFRGMQLESTLFGVCIIQIKPQLEKLLKLPNDSLTKEIQLTQDLLNLFIEYQIPSDLISYDGDVNASNTTKLDKVKDYVSKMQSMIQKSQQAQLNVAQEAQCLRMADNESSYGSVQVIHVSSERSRKEEYKEERSEKKKVSSSRQSTAPQVELVSRVKELTAPVQKTQREAVAKPQPAQIQNNAPSKPSTDSSKIQVQSEPIDSDVTDEDVIDYNKIPAELEQNFDKLNSESAVRPTIIKAGNTWTKKYQKALLSPPETMTLESDQQSTDRKKTFDLLDALTKSGVLSIDYASLHVVIAATHCFDRTLMDTVIQDNINPIEKIERSSLILSSTIQRKDTAQLIANNEQLERIATYSPQLITSVESV